VFAADFRRKRVLLEYLGPKRSPGFPIVASLANDNPLWRQMLRQEAMA
jgi:hypothetical protein